MEGCLKKMEIILMQQLTNLCFRNIMNKWKIKEKTLRITPMMAQEDRVHQVDSRFHS